MKTTDLTTLNIHQMPENIYEREKAAGRLDETALYLVEDFEENLKQDRLTWLTDEDVDAMFAGTYIGEGVDASIYNGEVEDV